VSQGVEVLRRARRPRDRDDAILVIVCLAQFVVALDVTIVNVAVPSIRAGLHLSAGALVWMLDAYALVFGGFMIAGGRAADLYGQRRTFLFGAGVFTVASLLGGLALNGATLVVARAVQGLGGAVLAPSTLRILATTFTDPRRRDRAYGLWGALNGVGGASGILFGGLALGLLSWRSIFLINVPIGSALFAMGWAALDNRRIERGDVRIDWFGALTGTAGLVALVYAITDTQRVGWGAATVQWWCAVAGVLLTVFVLVEHRHPHAILPLTILRNRSVAGANLAMFLNGAATFATFFFLSQYLQDVRGYPPPKVALAFLPMPLAIVLGNRIANRLVRRLGYRSVMAAGAGVGTLGFLLLSRLDVHGSYLLHVGIPGSVVSLGSGIGWVPLTLAATVAVPHTHAGVAAGLINTARQIGGAIGLAVLATIAAGVGRAAAAKGSPISDAATYTSGIAAAFLTASAFLAGSVVIALAIVPRRTSLRRPPLPRVASSTKTNERLSMGTAQRSAAAEQSAVGDDVVPVDRD
jgi:EmrB/QacA subfamily drug resistance transporter